MRLSAIVVAACAVATLTSCVSAVHSAAERGELERLDSAIEQGAPVDERDHRGRTALMYAAERGDIAMVRALVERGADVNAATSAESGQVTPLRFALESANLAMARELVSLGADVNQANTAGWTPLMTAARVGDFFVVEYLVEVGADPAARNREGADAAAVATANEHVNIAEWLSNQTEN